MNRLAMTIVVALVATTCLSAYSAQPSTTHDASALAWNSAVAADGERAASRGAFVSESLPKAGQAPVSAEAEKNRAVIDAGGVALASPSEGGAERDGFDAGVSNVSNLIKSMRAAPPTENRNSDYVLPDSDRVVYSTAELQKLSSDELSYARNELFARHGATFGDEKLSGYFGSKRWYRAIEPKLDEYDSGILNLVESMNAATLRRIEQQRGSKHVNPLDSNRAAMYEAYRTKVEEYQKRYGAIELAFDRDVHDGLMGLCLVQLVDLEGDGWEELLLAYHDGDNAPKGDFFNPGSYKVEVWSYQDGALERAKQMDADYTQAKSSYFMLCRVGDGYEFGSAKSYDGGLVYYYELSYSLNPAAGDRYWYNESDVSFGFEQMQTITAETLATLGVKGF